MSRLNFGRGAVDNAGVDQVSRPMQIVAVAAVLLLAMWFTVLKPKPADDSVPAPAPAASSAPTAPGTKGLSSAVDKAKAASAASDAANAKVQAATGEAKAPAAKATATKKAATAKATTVTKAKAKAVTPAKAKAAAPAKAKPAADVDPSDRLLAFLDKGKTLVVLFEGKGADDKAARKAVHLTAKRDPKHVVSAYVPISKVGDYMKLTSDINVYSSPSILVIGTDHKASLLSGYVDSESVRQAVGDARRQAAAAKP